MTMLNSNNGTIAATTGATTTIASALMIPTPTSPATIADISPSCSRECNSSDTTNPRKRNNSDISSSSSSSSFIRCPNCCIAKYCSNQCLQKGCCSTTTASASTTTSTTKNKATAAAAAAVVDNSCSSVCEVVTMSRRKVREIEKQIKLDLNLTTTPQ